jgi:hypothetical protein
VQVLRQGSTGTSAAVLGRLARLAGACARLHLRDTVLAMPDVVLAVAMFECSGAVMVGP